MLRAEGMEDAQLKEWSNQPDQGLREGLIVATLDCCAMA